MSGTSHAAAGSSSINKPSDPVGEIGFRITNQKGFHITFPNGCTVSVQFGPGNYADNYKEEIGRDGDLISGQRGSRTAEVGAWTAEEKWFDLETSFEPGDGCSPVGWRTPAQVLEILNKIAAWEQGSKTTEGQSDDR